MLDRSRIRLMTKMAEYEKTLASDDLKVSSYFKKDYTSINTLITAIWVTIGYIILCGLIILCNGEALINNMTPTRLIIVVVAAVGIYLTLVMVYCVCATSFYKSKHNKSKQRMKEYYRDLNRLGKMHMKENR